MDLKLDENTNFTKRCPACKVPVMTFHGLVDEIVVDLQPTTIKKERTGLLVCAQCGTVIWDESSKEAPIE